MTNANTKAFLARYLPGTLLFFVLSATYYASHFPIAASNDGSHFALISAMAEEQRFVIDTYFHFTDGVDYAERDGHYYSERPPGTAFLGVPFYWLGELVAQQRDFDKGEVVRHAVLLMPALFGAAAVLLFIGLLRKLGVSEFSAWTLGFIYGFASLQWKFSALLYSHGIAAFWFTLTWYFAVSTRDTDYPLRSRSMSAFALCLGYLPLLRNEYVFAIPFFLLYLFLVHGRKLIPSNRKESWDFLWNFSLFCLPLIALAIYNAICFGLPWATSAKFQNPRWEKNFAIETMFSTPWSEGVPKLLFQFPGSYPYGMFVLHPVMFFGLWGWYYFAKARWQEVLSQLLLIVTLVSLYGMYAFYGGGSSGDPRYLTPLIPLMLAPVAFWLDVVPQRISNHKLRALLFGVFGVCVVVGGIICFSHFSEHHGHDLDFRNDMPHYSLASKENFGVLASRVFVSADKLGLYAIFMSIISGIALVGVYLGYVWRLQRHKAKVAEVSDTQEVSQAA